MSTATMPSVDREPPRVGDWWMCPMCGDCRRSVVTCGGRDKPHRYCLCKPLTLTEADWLKCWNVDALVDMVVNLPGLHKETVAASQLMRREGPSNLTESAIRCIFGNPFRPLVPDPAWLTWNDGTVRRLAAAATSVPCHRCGGSGHYSYPTIELDDGEFIEEPVTCTLCEDVGGSRAIPRTHGNLDPSRFPILADALEEAGCHIDDVLRHLREPSAHWPGCFVLRAILEPNPPPPA